MTRKIAYAFNAKTKNNSTIEHENKQIFIRSESVRLICISLSKNVTWHIIKTYKFDTRINTNKQSLTNLNKVCSLNKSHPIPYTLTAGYYSAVPAIYGVPKSKIGHVTSATTPTDLICIFYLGPITLYMLTKFEVSSFSRSSGIRRMPRFKNKSRDVNHDPYWSNLHIFI